MDRKGNGIEVNKKVLMIAQYFPPAGSVGTLRIAKFVKYLKEFGWQPVVLTVLKECYPTAVWLDTDLNKDVPDDVHIYRTNIWRSSFINDEGIRWLPFLLRNIFKIIRKERPNLIYIVGGPFFPLIVGPIVKLFFRLPYVVDLRDPWRTARVYQPSRGLKSRISRVLTSILEPIVFRFATKVICVTKTMLKEYLSVYPQHKKKFLVITNGYDPEDFINLKAKKYKKFTIAYTGKFRRTEAFHNPEPIFQAIKILRNMETDIQLIHVGAIEQEVIELVKKIGIENTIKFVGPKVHKEALNYAKGADLLLVIGSDRKMGLPVKMFDYIGCQRPILILAYEDEELTKILGGISWVKLIQNKDPQIIADTIMEFYKTKFLVSRTDNIGKCYERKYLTNTLAQVFDKAIL